MNRVEELYAHYTKHFSVTTDTRKIDRNTIFFALKGINFNGNQFAKEALQKGAILAVVDEEEFAVNDSFFLVDDVLKMLQKLAKHHREQLEIPVIGLTGSNGKTTTKELINAVLRQEFKICFTQGNLNNHIGVPLTLLSIGPKHDLAIVEMGANHQKEIGFLCNLSQPDIGYITNFGKAHLEGFGGVEGVIQGKSELYDYLRNHKKKTFVNFHDAKQVQKSKGIDRISFGPEGSDYIFTYQMEETNLVSLFYNKTKFESNLTGEYNATNIAVAIALGLYFNLSLNQIKQGVESYIPENNRSQIIKKGDMRILLDAYNANPSSMQEALKNFAQFAGSKTVILGDMFELGKESNSEHQEILQLAENLNFDQIIAIGMEFLSCKSEKDSTMIFQDTTQVNEYLSDAWTQTQNVLVKGSRGMRLETLNIVLD